jgi:hypothetical protein
VRGSLRSMPSRRAHSVAILNRSSVISDADAEKIVEALQVQASRDFAAVWGIDARLNFVPSTSTKGWQGKWNLVLLDTSDEANALGYHDLTPEGLPVGKVFAKSDAQYGAKVSVTCSHELLEMLLDPYISLCAEDPARGVFVAYEASDAVEADELGYDIDGVTVSDFVTPEFFDPTAAKRKGERFSFRGNVAKPFELAHGGYESIFVPGRGWTQRTARSEPSALDRPRVGSRRERRMTPTAEWVVSAG